MINLMLPKLICVLPILPWKSNTFQMPGDHGFKPTVQNLCKAFKVAPKCIYFILTSYIDFNWSKLHIQTHGENTHTINNVIDYHYLAVFSL